MAETSKNKIYYNDNEDNIADVLADMKKLAESTDNAIEGAKYDDTELKKKNQTQDEEISEINKKGTTQDNLIEELQTKVVNLEAENTSLKNQIPSGEATGNPIHLTDSSNMECEIVPIGGAEQETRSGKNEFDKRLIESVINGTYENDILKNTAGQMNLQIVTSGITLDANTQYIVFKAKLESGTYSVGFSSIQCLDGNGFALTAVSNPSLSSEYKEYIFSKEITESKTFKNILFQLFSNTDAVVLIKDIMITTSNDTSHEQYGAMPSPEFPSPIQTVGQNGSVEISVDNGLETTDTNYQSYTKVLPIQKEFVKIGDVEDTFVKQDGKWYEAHYHPKYTMTGNETILNSTTLTDVTRYIIQVNNIVNAQGLCNYYKYLNSYTSNTEHFYLATNQVVLFDKENSSSTFKNRLKSLYDNNTPVIVYPTLKEPELIKCTEEQSAILNSFYTYKGITNVSMSGIGKIKIIYKQDQQTINKNYENRLAALEAAAVS